MDNNIHGNNQPQQTHQDDTRCIPQLNASKDLPLLLPQYMVILRDLDILANKPVIPNSVLVAGSLNARNGLRVNGQLLVLNHQPWSALRTYLHGDKGDFVDGEMTKPLGRTITSIDGSSQRIQESPWLVEGYLNCKTSYKVKSQLAVFNKDKERLHWAGMLAWAKLAEMKKVAEMHLKVPKPPFYDDAITEKDIESLTLLIQETTRFYNPETPESNDQLEIENKKGLVIAKGVEGVARGVKRFHHEHRRCLEKVKSKLRKQKARSLSNPHHKGNEYQPLESIETEIPNQGGMLRCLGDQGTLPVQTVVDVAMTNDAGNVHIPTTSSAEADHHHRSMSSSFGELERDLEEFEHNSHADSQDVISLTEGRATAKLPEEFGLDMTSDEQPIIASIETDDSNTGAKTTPGQNNTGGDLPPMERGSDREDSMTSLFGDSDDEFGIGT